MGEKAIQESKKEDNQSPTEDSKTLPHLEHSLIPSDIILHIKEERERNEKAVQELKTMMAQQQQLYALFALGGKSNAGQEPPKPKTPDEIAQEQADITIRKFFKK